MQRKDGEKGQALDKNKLKNYDLTASIHTVQIDSRDNPVIGAGDERFIKAWSTTNCNTGEFVSHNRINPHNYGMGELLRYSHYENVMADLTAHAELHTYGYSRLDIRLDSYERNYIEYFKLNCLLISLFSMVYKIKNDEPTVSSGLMTRFQYGVYVNNQSIGIVYYDKEKESQGKYPCKARLEFKEYKAAGKTPTEIAKLWFNRLDRLERQYNKLQDKCNISLFEYYQKWLAENQPKNSKDTMLREFVRANKDVIFSSRQLVKFCRMCGVTNPESRAKNLKKSCRIEFFLHSDIRGYIEKIKKSITQYIEQ